MAVCFFFAPTLLRCGLDRPLYNPPPTPSSPHPLLHICAIRFLAGVRKQQQQQRGLRACRIHRPRHRRAAKIAPSSRLHCIFPARVTATPPLSSYRTPPDTRQRTGEFIRHTICDGSKSVVQNISRSESGRSSSPTCPALSGTTMTGRSSSSTVLALSPPRKL